MISPMSSRSRGFPPDSTRSTTPKSRRIVRPLLTSSVDSSLVSCSRQTLHPLHRKLHFLVSIHWAWYGLLGVRDLTAILRALLIDITKESSASWLSWQITVSLLQNRDIGKSYIKVGFSENKQYNGSRARYWLSFRFGFKGHASGRGRGRSWFHLTLRY